MLLSTGKHQIWLKARSNLYFLAPSHDVCGLRYGIALPVTDSRFVIYYQQLIYLNRQFPGTKYMHFSD
jgi:hypothetical protein